MPGSFGGIFMNREIAGRVDRIVFLSRLDDEFLWKLPIGESRQAKHARRVRCREIAAKLIGEAVQQRFRFVLTESAHFPYDLVLTGRGIEDKVWRWHRRRISNRFESYVTLSVEVEIDVADVLYILLGPGVSAVLNGIHSHEHVGTAGI